jgi:SHS2 domain-containing protein
MKKIFNELEHTADIAIEVYGKTLSELFQNALTAFYSILFALDDLSSLPKGQDEFQMKLKEDDLETLLHTFLSELNYLFTVKYTILYPVQELTIQSSKKDEITLELKARTVSPVPQALKEQAMEIKAVTLHQLKVRQEANQFTAHIIFDI